MKYKEIEEDGGNHSNSNALQQKYCLNTFTQKGHLRKNMAKNKNPKLFLIPYCLLSSFF
jgi:hypothetical protein